MSRREKIKDAMPFWEKKRPKGKKKKLTARQKAEAKKRAKKKGRRYPNLVDNAAASKGRKKRPMSDEDYFEI